MHRCIECINGLCEGTVFPLGKRITIGRSADNDIRVACDREMSRHHACVRETNDGKVRLEDLESHNGTFLGVGNKRITTAPLESGDSFRVGESIFIFVELSDLEFDTHMKRQLLKTGSSPTMDQTRTSVMQSRSEPCPHPSHHAADKRFRFCPACGQKLY
ncbi:MAG: FHA domain-containing protein [Lentisphaeria bacterium]|nr:FHA domain-containing protein [Lentisphaeria bacterium]